MESVYLEGDVDFVVVIDELFEMEVKCDVDLLFCVDYGYMLLFDVEWDF